jgi:arylsulfatase
MAAYAAMVDEMDQGIGRIIKSLKKQGEYENTLILFLADNGGSAERMGRGGDFTPRPDEPENPMKRDAPQKSMVPDFTRAGYPVRQGKGVMPGPANTYIGYGAGWANASNTPFRLFKHFNHKGGIATPLIAHWPRRIDANGDFVRDPAHLVDVMATCVELAGASYPDERDGKNIKPMQRISLAPAFAGNKFKREQPLFFEHEGRRALRDGKWKAVARRGDKDWELYDMQADRSETNDLAEKQPDRLLTPAFLKFTGRVVRYGLI